MVFKVNFKFSQKRIPVFNFKRLNTPKYIYSTLAVFLFLNPMFSCFHFLFLHVISLQTSLVSSALVVYTATQIYPEKILTAQRLVYYLNSSSLLHQLVHEHQHSVSAVLQKAMLKVELTW